MSERKSQLWRRAALTSAMVVALCVAGAGSAAADPNSAPSPAVSISMYNGVVGQPIDFDAGVVFSNENGEIAGYYWDWFGDNRTEFFSTDSQAQQTWHSAFSGHVRVGAFDQDNGLDWGRITVNVTGPENVVAATLKSSGDLHIYGPRGRHVGANPQSGQLETLLPDSLFAVLAADGNEVAFSARADAEGLSQIAAFPLYIGGTYQIRIVGTSDGPFELTVCGNQNDKCVVEKTVKGDIRKGEIVSVDVTAGCPAGALEMTCGEVVFCPGLAVEPREINLVVEAGKTYEVPITVRELFGRAPLKSVHLACSDIAGSVNLIRGGEVSFDKNDFDMEANEQKVVVSIPVPQSFMGMAAGTITVQCAGGGSKTINVVVKTPGTCTPHCNPIGPFTGTVGVPITFDASNSYDPDGVIFSYSWDWGDGTSDSTDQPVISHTWNSEFSGTVTLYVFDDDCNFEHTEIQVTVTNP